MRLMMFTKHLQSLSLAQAGSTIRNLGFEGADLTVRPLGFVLPEEVHTELPRAVETLKECGVRVPLLTTTITRADEPTAVDTFEAAAACGVREIKLGYVRYEKFGTFRQTLQQMQRDLDGIEALAKRTKVRANLHLHSDDFMTALSSTVLTLIEHRDPAAVGAYIDPGHMVIEGGGDGWRMGLDLLASRISIVAIKDVAWEKTELTDDRPRRRHKIVPLRQGMVPWPKVFACLRQAGFDGWLSVHSEYQGQHSWKDLSLSELVEQTRDDLKYLREVMAEPRPPAKASP